MTHGLTFCLGNHLTAWAAISPARDLNIAVIDATLPLQGGNDEFHATSCSNHRLALYTKHAPSIPSQQLLLCTTQQYCTKTGYLIPLKVLRKKENIPELVEKTGLETRCVLFSTPHEMLHVIDVIVDIMQFPV